jgi:hypothetical protein
MGKLLLLHILKECSKTSERTGNYTIKSKRIITHNTVIINFFTATRFAEYFVFQFAIQKFKDRGI